MHSFLVKNMRYQNDKERILNNIIINEKTGCWETTLRLSGGYGVSFLIIWK